MKIFNVRSFWGAHGAFLVLQSYGLFLFYLFAGSIESIRATDSTSGAHPVIDLVALVLLLPILIMMESVMLSEIRGAIRAGIPVATDKREERLKALVCILLVILYVLLLFRPELLGLPDAPILWAVAFQLLHLSSAALLGERMSSTLAGEIPTQVDQSPGESLVFSRMFILMGFFLVGCAFIPDAPFWTFMALGSTFFCWGSIFALLQKIA